MNGFPELAGALPAIPPSRAEPALTSARQLARCSSRTARSRLSAAQAEKLGVLPLALQQSGGEELLVAAFAEPLDPNAVMAVRFATGLNVAAEVVPPRLLGEALTLAYWGEAVELQKVSAEANRACPGREPLAPDMLSVAEREIPRLLSTLIHRVLYLNGSDLHLEPTADGTRVRIRVDGILREEAGVRLGTETAQQLGRRLKVLAGLESNGLKLVQEGGFTFHHEGRAVRLRLSILPLVEGEKIVLRILDEPHQEAEMSPAGLGLLPEQEALLNAALAAERGAILLSGPTGSGKSTLLYAALLRLNQEWRNIITIEDPVERLIPGANQTQVNRELGLDYATLLPKLLRQDPNVIMIGEIRDSETAHTALTAAITGSLVLSTVHAGSVFELLLRLSQLGVPPELQASAVRLLVSQRLLPLNCRRCRRAERAASLIGRLFLLEPHTVLWRAAGCEECRFTGISGRKGVYELLPLNGRLRELLLGLSPGRTFPPLDRLFAAAEEQGFRPLRLAVREALIEGAIAPNTAAHALGIDPEIIREQ